MRISDSKTVVILGATGFIGKYLCKEACKRGYKVRAVGRKKEMPVELADKQELQYFSSTYEVESIREAVLNADAVINLAATRSSGAFSNADYIRNIELTANCLEACRLEGIKKVVMLSSRAVYHEEDDGREDAFVNPISLYGESKLASDNLCVFYNRKYQMETVSLRCAQVLGWGEREGYVLNTFLDRAKNKETLEVWGKGVSIRRYIYIKDVIDALLFAINTEQAGIFNIGMQEAISLAELANIINKVFENEGNIKYIPYDKEDKAIDNMSIEKATNILQWQPQYDMISALKDMQNDYKKGIEE